jgi:hypothetical protein
MLARGGCVTEVRLDILGKLEVRFRADRQHPARVLQAWSCADPSLDAVARAIAAVLDDDAARRGEPPYHDRHHVAETVVAMDLLCAQAVRLGLMPTDLAQLGVLAMLGHDLGHDGSLAVSGVLEAMSADRVAVLAASLPTAQVAVLRHVILATAQHRIAANLARAAQPDASPLEVLAALANEADVLASLMPGLGARLAERLAREWRRHDPARAHAVVSPAGRRAFLSLYASPTAPARAVGVDRMVAGQLG